MTSPNRSCRFALVVRSCAFALVPGLYGCSSSGASSNAVPTTRHSDDGAAAASGDGGASSGAPGASGSGDDGGSPGTVTLPGGDAGSYTAPSGPVDFGPNVLIFDPSMGDATIQSKIDAVFTAQETNQFGTDRYAYFFKPGTYDLDVELGFYMEVLGLAAAT